MSIRGLRESKIEATEGQLITILTSRGNQRTVTAKNSLTALPTKAVVIRMDEMDRFLQRMDRIRRENAQEADIGQRPEYECLKCRDTGYILQRDENGCEVARKCECCDTKQAKKMLMRSGISEEFRKKTFENFNTLGNRQLENAKNKAMQYAAHFFSTEHDRCNSIMFAGQVGAGKTHLGTAICGILMKNEVAVTYMAYRNAVTKIKQNIVDEEAYSKEMSRYTLARVLYIDDLLKGRLTDSDINIMYEIVNYRYMNNMPFIISTEKMPSELIDFDEAIGSRLIEMCRGNIIQLQGKELNYRLSQEVMRGWQR